MSKSFPVNIKQLEEELLEHSKGGNSDIVMRPNIVMSQIGPMLSHLTHDKQYTPDARPYGSRDSEMNDCGHAVVQLMTYVAMRGQQKGFTLQECIDVALEGLRNKEFQAKQAASPTSVKGLATVHTGSLIIEGPAWVDPECKKLKDMPPSWILVASHPTTKITPFIHKIAGIVTDHGGMTCHAAIVARENGIPCVVGTGNATKVIEKGQSIRFKGDEIVSCAGDVV